MTVLEDFEIAFASGAFPDDRIRLFGARGREELSRLFELELLFSREGEPFTDAEVDSLLEAPCAVAFGPTPGDIVHGLLRRVRLLDTSGTITNRYLATMVPTAWLLTLSRTNRIFQNLTVPAIVQTILTQYGLAQGQDFDFVTTQNYLEREYVVQYEESDWDFIQRWLEHEGIFYWFEHGGTSDKLVFSDASNCATPIPAPEAISYRRRNDLATGGVSTVWEWSLDQQRIPARVAVFDYNYRTPNVRLVGKATVDETRGFGSAMYYSDHFRTNEEGMQVATTRAQRFQCARKVYTGWTDCPRFRVGHAFELQDHYESSNDGRYMITALDHKVGFAIPDLDVEWGAGSETLQGYRARFETLPIAVPFRPAMVTPWPSIHGVMHGHIEEDGAGDYAQIDSEGRYKVRMPFDSGNLPGTQVSQWMRMAQAYSGAGYGSHNPLHKGAEVLVAHLDGDPDRPIILGTAPHAHTVSPVTQTNLTQSVVHTPSGLRIELEDLQE